MEPDKIIEDLIGLIKIPSVGETSASTAPKDAKKPFGENVNNALEYMLNLGKEMGFKTKNINGYCRNNRVWRRRGINTA